MKCGLTCFKHCAILNPDARRISNIGDYYKQIIEKLDELIVQQRQNIPDEKLIGGLLAHREHQVCKAFCEQPGSFTDVFQVNDPISKDTKALKRKDIILSREVNYFIALHISKGYLSMRMVEANNKEILVYCTPQGMKYIEDQIKDPEKHGLHTIVREDAYQDGKYLAERDCYDIMTFLPADNVGLMRWCRRNYFKRSIFEFDHRESMKRILHHMAEPFTTGEIDARKCYELSYRPFINAIYSLKNVYSHSAQFLKIARDYKGVHEKCEKLFSWFPIWDHTLLQLFQREEKGDFFTKKVDVVESPDYPIHLSGESLYPSLRSQVFISKNWQEICSKRWEKGIIFENKIENDLKERRAKILCRNYQISPEDEIDLLVENKGKYFLIEAKDYGPNWNRQHLSGSKYINRVQDLNSRVALAARRLEWVKTNKGRFDLPPDANVQGTIITSYYEPELEIPKGFIYLTPNKIKDYFGKKDESVGWKKNPVFKIPKEILRTAHERAKK